MLADGTQPDTGIVAAIIAITGAVTTAVTVGVPLLIKWWQAKSSTSIAETKASRAEHDKAAKSKQDREDHVIVRQREMIDDLIAKFSVLQGRVDKLQEDHAECREREARLQVRVEWLERSAHGDASAGS